MSEASHNQKPIDSQKNSEKNCEFHTNIGNDEKMQSSRPVELDRLWADYKKMNPIKRIKYQMC